MAESQNIKKAPVEKEEAASRDGPVASDKNELDEDQLQDVSGGLPDLDGNAHA
jgi:carotenoid cleavage dioxygenase-like enzyme